MPEIVLRRSDGGLIGRWDSHRIFVDGQREGTLRHGDAIRLSVTPGRHTVVAKTDRFDCGSKPLELALGANDRANVLCRRGRASLLLLLPGWGFILARLLAPTSWIDLQLVGVEPTD